MAIIGTPAAFSPIRVGEVELVEPLPDVGHGATSTGVPFARAWLLVRLHGWPLGIVDMSLEAGTDAEAGADAQAGALGAVIAERLGPRIREHLATDGLSSEGVPLLVPAPNPPGPRCQARIAHVLADAPSVSVVVPTVDRPDALRQCLEGLRDQTYPDAEVIVVDNAPGASGAAEVVAALGPSMPRLRCVEEPRPGASRARNRGIASATGDIVAFIDGDARPDPSWLAALVTALATPLDGGGRAACATGLILPASLESEPQLWLEEWGGYGKGFERRELDLRRRRAIGPMFPFAIAACGSGASMALRRADLLELGGFDPALGPGTPSRSGEDLGLLLDVVSGGGTVVYEPGAIVWHTHPATEAAFRETLRRYGIGLTAYLTRHLARRPGDVARLIGAMPAALAYFLHPDSDRNRRRSRTFPRDVRGVETGGMLLGPFAYAAGRARLRGERRRERADEPRRERRRSGSGAPR